MISDLHVKGNDERNQRMAQQVKKELVTKKQTECLEEVKKFVHASVVAAGYSDKDRRLIALAVQTAANGIIQNAREQEIKGDLSIKIDADETRLRIEINDAGDALMFASPGGIARPKHDLGIFLIRQIMHEVEYEYKRGFISKLTMTRFRG